MGLKARVKKAGDLGDFLAITADELGLSNDSRSAHKKRFDDNFEAPQSVCELFGENVRIKFNATFEIVHVVDVDDESSQRLIEVNVNSRVTNDGKKIDYESTFKKFVLPYPKEDTKAKMREEIRDKTRTHVQKSFLNGIRKQIKKDRNMQKSLLGMLRQKPDKNSE